MNSNIVSRVGTGLRLNITSIEEYARLMSQQPVIIHAQIPSKVPIQEYTPRQIIRSKRGRVINPPKYLKRIGKYTLEIFLQRTLEIQGDVFDLTNVTEEHIKGCDSHVPISCKTCFYEWAPTISGIISGKGCPDCHGALKWTKDRFIIAAIKIHGEKYDYSEITEEHVQGQKSHVPITCTICYYRWNPVVNHHIHNKTGCPRCAHRIPYTLESVIAGAVYVHGNSYNYSLIREEHIENAHSHVPIKCNTCDYIWNPTISHHINNGTNCPKCSGQEPVTLPRCLQLLQEIHGDLYDYSEIAEIENCNTRVVIRCFTCNNKWNPEIRSLIYNKSGCPTCNSPARSKGEKHCGKILGDLGIIYDPQARINSLPTRFYDYGFLYNNQRWILEYDGSQHFKMSKFFHDTQEVFLERQQIDKLKTNMALAEGYKVIRIDHTQINKIPYHIEQAFNTNQSLYLSTPEMYEYLFN